MHNWLSEISNSLYVSSYGNNTVSTLSRNDYTYDPTGQRLTNTITDNTGAVRTEQYGYDDLNRLSNVNYGDGQTQSYGFDPMGNRLSKTDSGGGINGTEGYSYNNANMLLSRAGNAYTNDANGNTLSGGGRTNTWDSENRLTQCVYNGTTSQFTYAADGIRHRSVVNGTTTDFVLDASMFVRELRGGVNYATYLMGPGGPLYRRDDTACTVSWYLFDGLGSVLDEVSPGGTVTAKRKYDVYGAVRTGADGTSAQKFVGQLGHPSEDNTGLVYMRARYMDPACGRFESHDPSAHGVNWYVYCSSDPVNRVDRSGRIDGIGATLDLEADDAQMDFGAGLGIIAKIYAIVAGAYIVWECAVLGMFIKPDLKDFRAAMRAGGLDPNDMDVHERFHDYITGDGLDFQGMVEAAKDFAALLAAEKGQDGTQGDDDGDD